MKYPIARHDDGDKTEPLKAYAKESGLTVVARDDEARDDTLAARVIYPLAYAKQKQADGKQKRIFLTDDFWVECERCDNPSGANNGERVPPAFDL